MIGCIFCLQVDGPMTGGTFNLGGGGAHMQLFMVPYHT